MDPEVGVNARENQARRQWRQQEQKYFHESPSLPGIALPNLLERLTSRLIS